MKLFGRFVADTNGQYRGVRVRRVGGRVFNSLGDEKGVSYRVTRDDSNEGFSPDYS